MSDHRNEKKLVEDLSIFCLAKLRGNSHKEHWRKIDLDYLIKRTKQEIEELENAIREGASIHAVWEEAADVANFAAMTADTYSTIRNLGLLVMNE